MVDINYEILIVVSLLSIIVLYVIDIVSVNLLVSNSCKGNMKGKMGVNFYI